MLESLQRSMIGRTVGQYQIDDAFSPGKSGQTYRVSRRDGNLVVAMKLLKPMRFDTALQAVFFSELEAVHNLEHVNIVKVIDFGEDHPHYFVVSEMVPDGSLNTWLQQETRDNRRPPLELGLDLMRQAAEGLAYAHRKAIVHGEIQPGNMLLIRAGSGFKLKLSDFRLAQIVMRGSGNSGDDVGILNEPKYVSPDHVMPGGIQSASDIYSLGIVMYHVFTGLVPFEVRDHGDAMVKHLYEIPRPLREARADIYPELETLVLKCLHKRPSERPTADEVRDTIQAILELYHKNVRSTRMLSPVERVQNTPNIPTPEFKSDWPRISVVDSSGQVIGVRELTPSGLSVGREHDNSIVLDADTVSRHHMRLEYDGQEVKLTDFSTNGSFLIGGGSEQTRLASHIPTNWPWRSIIQVAPYWLRLEQPSSMSAPTRLVVSLDKERVELVPGQPTTIRVTVANLGRLVDHLSFEVEGMPEEWVRVPEDRWQLLPSGQGSVLLTITPPRTSEARAGDYRVKIRAKSLELKDENGNLEFGEALALWVVLPFTESKLGLRPSNRSTRRHTKFTAYLENQSNTPIRFQVKAQDSNRKLITSFEETKPPLRFPPNWQGVLMRWFYVLIAPFRNLYYLLITTTIGPYLMRLAQIQRDAKEIIGHEDGANSKDKAPERRPDPDYSLSQSLLIC
jgi:eukaryotic-like serine/threonine-protein kinase